MNPRTYYREDLINSAIELRRLGRRCKEARNVGQDRFRPHKFWSNYMSAVTAEAVRGRWLGLAPLRVLFRSSTGESLPRLIPDCGKGSDPTLTSIVVRAYPKGFVTPIGWAVGVVAEIQGELSLSQVAPLVNYLRSETVFSQGGRIVTLSEVLSALDGRIRNSLLVGTASRDYPVLNAYSVSGPIEFQDQLGFDGLDTGLDIPLIFRIIGAEGPAGDDRRIITTRPKSVAVTVFRRGTFLVTGILPVPQQRRDRSPGCALSSLKNALLLTSLMQKYHQKSVGRTDTQVAQMRNEVAKTFEVMKNSWEAPHFQQICDRDTGIQKLLQGAHVVPAEITDQKGEQVTQRLNTVLAFAFGVIFVTAILWIVVKNPNPSPTQMKVFSVVLALAAGGIATVISGMLKVTLTAGKRLAIGATGALAVFVIVYFFVPALAQ